MNKIDIRHEQLKEQDYNLAKEILKQDNDLGEELLRTLSHEPELLYAMFLDNKLIALAQVEKATPQAYLSVFVAPLYRRQGFGASMLKYAEDILLDVGTITVMSSFHANNKESLAFARKHGYNTNFSSALMKRTGEPFLLEELPVRPYRDEDYIKSQALSAIAFHEMRVRVGCFPNSVIAKPSEKGRKAWEEDKKNYFIYEEDDEIVALGHLSVNEISSISVHTDFQGKGIGKKFTMYLSNELYRRGYETIELWCVVGNYARNMYDSLGYKEKYIAEYPLKRLQ